MLQQYDDGIVGKNYGKKPSNDSNLFAISLWWIWKYWNEVIFNNSERPLQSKVAWVMSQIDKVSRTFSRSQTHQNTTAPNSWTKLIWTKPQEGFVKLNIDGSVDYHSNAACCGGAIRDSNGRWKSGFLYNFGVCSPLQAEAWALLRGIQLAVFMGYKKVIIESDSSVIVESFGKETTPNSVVHNILKACNTRVEVF